MKKNKWIKISAVILAVVVIFFVVRGIGSGNAAPSTIEYTELYPTELVNSISTKGRVESAQKSNVYSSVNYTIQAVNVEVGDWVGKGQILCKLDTKSLEYDISKAKADLSNSSRTASNNLNKAKSDYSNAVSDYENNTDSQVANAQSNLVSAELDLNTKIKTYETNSTLYEMGAITLNELEQSENAYINAKNKYNDAQVSLQNAQNAQSRSIDQAQYSLNSAQISSNTSAQGISIQKLEQQLADARIKAPQSGVVTAVYATEGATGNGLLFVIEDVDNLKITTTIKEYDVCNVWEGMSVTIKSDSTGNAEYEGILRKVSPAAVKNAMGETDILLGTEFEAEVEITSPQTDLKVGMEARLAIILDRKDGIYGVPSDAVKTDKNGVSTIFIAKDGVAKEIVVATGMETDFYIEIYGDELKHGMKVLSDASAIKDGAKVVID